MTCQHVLCERGLLGREKTATWKTQSQPNRPNDLYITYSWQTYMYTFHQRSQSAGSECGLSQEQHPWGRQEVSVKDSLAGLKQTEDLAHRGSSKTWREKSERTERETGKTALLYTFSLQLSSTSVLIRPSHPSLNQAGSLQHTQWGTTVNLHTTS